MSVAKPQYVRHTTIPSSFLQQRGWCLFSEMQTIFNLYKSFNVRDPDDRISLMCYLIELKQMGSKIVDWDKRFPAEGMYFFKNWYVQDLLVHMIRGIELYEQLHPRAYHFDIIEEFEDAHQEIHFVMGRDQVPKHGYFTRHTFEDSLNLCWMENPVVPEGARVEDDITRPHSIGRINYTIDAMSKQFWRNLFVSSKRRSSDKKSKPSGQEPKSIDDVIRRPYVRGSSSESSGMSSDDDADYNQAGPSGVAAAASERAELSTLEGVASTSAAAASLEGVASTSAAAASLEGVASTSAAAASLEGFAISSAAAASLEDLAISSAAAARLEGFAPSSAAVARLIGFASTLAAATRLVGVPPTSAARAMPIGVRRRATYSGSSSESFSGSSEKQDKPDEMLDKVADPKKRRRNDE